MQTKTGLQSDRFSLLMAPKTVIDPNGPEQTGSDEKPPVLQRLADPADKSQNLASESVTEITANEEAKMVLPTDLEFELSWQTRDSIIACLSKHTKLLSGLIISDRNREQMREMNENLVAALMNLPLKTGSEIPKEPGCSSCVRKNSNEVVLDLSWNARLKVVDTLMTSHTVALLEGGSVAGECKAKLIDQNNRLVSELLHLRSRTVAVEPFKAKHPLISVFPYLIFLLGLSLVVLNFPELNLPEFPNYLVWLFFLALCFQFSWFLF